MHKMQDWASSVSQQAWSKPLPDQDRIKLVESMDFGENEDIDATCCWSCLSRKKSPGYFKVKSY